MATAVDKWPAYARLSAVAQAGHLPTAPTPPLGTRPRRKRCHIPLRTVRAAGRLLENSPAAAVEVWQGPGRVIHPTE